MSVLSDFLGLTQDVTKSLGVSSIADFYVQRQRDKIALETAKSQTTIDQLNNSIGYLQQANQQLYEAQQLKKGSVLGDMGTGWVKYALLAGAAFALYKIVK